jgi:hypothetical protein
MPLEHLLKTLDMLLRLVAVRQERLLQLRRFRGLRDFGQVLEDLTLGKINILERIKAKVVELRSAMSKPPALQAYSTGCGRPCSPIKAR